MTDAMDAIASAFPNNKFAIVDVDVTVMKHKPKNVEGLLFKEQEAGYLVGYAAGLWAKSHGGKAVGSVGGLKIPPVDRYIAGFQYGAKKADPGIKTLNDYSKDFVKQAKCKEKALNQIAQGLGRRVPGRGPVRPRRPRRGAREEHLRRRRRRRPGLSRLVGHDERAEAGRRRRVQRDQRANDGKLKGGNERSIRRQGRRRRVRQVELEGSRFDQESGRRAVHDAEGRQDQGHPAQPSSRRSGHVDSSTGRAHHGPPLYVRAMRLRPALVASLLLCVGAAGCGGTKTTTVHDEARRAARGAATGLRVGVVGPLRVRVAGARPRARHGSRTSPATRWSLVSRRAVDPPAARRVAREHPSSHFALVGARDRRQQEAERARPRAERGRGGGTRRRRRRSRRRRRAERRRVSRGSGPRSVRSRRPSRAARTRASRRDRAARVVATTSRPRARRPRSARSAAGRSS